MLCTDAKNKCLLLAIFLALSCGAAAKTYTLSNNAAALPPSWACSAGSWEVRCSGDVTLGADDEVRVDNAIPDSEKPLLWRLENGATLTVEDGASDNPACINSSGTSPCSLDGGSPDALRIKTTGSVVIGQYAQVVAEIESGSSIDASESSSIQGSLETSDSDDGQITLNQDVTLQGNINSATSADIGQGGDVQGSITAEHSIDTGQNSEITGGLETKAEDDGQITLNQNTKVGGEITSAEDVDIGQGSTVQDDVTARTQVDTGQNFKIDGTVRTKEEDAGQIDLDQDGTVTGNLIAQGDVSISQGTLVEGDSFAECREMDISGTIGGCGIAGQVDASDGTVKGGIIESCGDVDEKNLGSGTPELAGLSGQTTRATGDIKIYQGRFNGDEWTGELKAIPVTDGFRANASNAKWKASENIKPPDDRDIYTHDEESTGGTQGAEFRWTKLDSDQQSELTEPGELPTFGQALVDYLRGDRRNEGTTENDFRVRSDVLGPIINSKPALTTAVDYEFEKGADHAFDNEPGALSSSYEAHVDSADEVVYVGSNDGMLHAFDASNGTELFAYVPDTAYAKFRAFAEADEASPGAYRHYFVDAPPKLAHAYFNDWKTILIGSGGAGGQSVFALDVTEPDNFTASDVLWEFNGGATPEDMGHSIGQPTFARLSDEGWVAIFGNGYGTGEAKLFVIDLRTGQVIKKVDMTSADDSTDTRNGLISVTPFDNDGDRIADWIYAGDLQGNLWKYDVTGKSSKWGLATKGKQPFFSAGFTKGAKNTQTQPITARPVVGPAPTPGDVMVYFGTGEQMRDAVDQNPIEMISDDDDQQAFYAVRDSTDGTGGLSRADLQKQEIKNEIDGNSGADYRVLTDNEVDYEDQEGWFIDLPAQSGNGAGIVKREVVIDAAQLERGLERPRVVFNSLVSGSGSCNLGSDSWLMEADAYTGGPLEKALFDVDGDGEINANDAVTGNVHATGRKMNAVTSQPLILGGGSGTETLLMGDSTGGIQEVDQSTQEDGREGWLQIE